MEGEWREQILTFCLRVMQISARENFQCPIKHTAHWFGEKIDKETTTTTKNWSEDEVKHVWTQDNLTYTDLEVL